MHFLTNHKKKGETIIHIGKYRFIELCEKKQIFLDSVDDRGLNFVYQYRTVPSSRLYDPLIIPTVL